MEETICVVGYGCVLPNSPNPEKFWENIVKNNCAIRELPKERLNKDIYVDEKDPDKTYTNMAGYIDEKDLKKGKYDTRLQAMAVEATKQAVHNVKIKKNTGIYLGCMSQDEEFSLKRYLFDRGDDILKSTNDEAWKNKFIQKYQYKKINESTILPYTMPTSAIKSIADELGINALGCIIDAACASSIIAVDIAAEALRNKTHDIVITGGVEANLSIESYVMFSRTNALAKYKCLPFDKNSKGLSQGEGSVIFVLKRLNDAIVDGDKVYAIVHKAGISSDGNSSSLFAPTKEGQKRAYEEAYRKLNKVPNYIECHGTGTTLGDMTEIDSINEYFNSNIQIGSAKAFFGHTKGTAGSVGILKALLMILNETIPPYRPNKPIENIGKIDMLDKITKKHIELVGVSSFGFGGINSHIAIEKYNNNVMNKINNKDQKIYITRSVKVREKDLRGDELNVPPASLGQIDVIQKMAVLATESLFETLGIPIEKIESKDISVISASTTGLERIINLGGRTHSYLLTEKIGGLLFPKQEFERIRNYYKEVNEDTGPGMLNNVIAGRIANKYNFKGESYNIDSDLGSYPIAIDIGKRVIKRRSGAVIIINVQEKIVEGRIKRVSVTASLLTSRLYAKKYSIKIKNEISKVIYD